LSKAIEIGDSAFYLTKVSQLTCLNLIKLGKKAFQGTTVKEFYFPKITTFVNGVFSDCK
jgi:hypothetical protein